MEKQARHDRIEEYIKEAVADFISRETNKTSLITVTRVRLSESLKKAEVLVTVYPEEKEEEVLHFLKRNGTEVRGYVKNHIRTRVIPHLDFDIDKGEKHRQRLDELSQ